MSNRNRRIVLAIFFAIFMTTLVLMAARASADPTPAPRDLYVAKIVPLADEQIRVTLSNGKTDALKPCRYEDGRHCYWVADRMGNKRGQSFLVTRGHVFKMNLSGL